MNRQASGRKEGDAICNDAEASEAGPPSHRHGTSARGVGGEIADPAVSGLARPNPDNEHSGDVFATAKDGRERRPDRYHGLPVVVIREPDGTTRPAPFLMRQDEVAAFFRLHETNTKFPEKTIQRYRRMGLRTVRVGRRVWFRLDDVLRFLDEQQERLCWASR